MTKRSRIVLTAMALAVLVIGLWLVGDFFKPVIPDPELVAPLPPSVDTTELNQPEAEQPVVDAPDVLDELSPDENATTPTKSKVEAKFITLTPDSRGRYGYEVLFQVVGRYGRPIAGAHIALGPDQHPTNIMGQTAGDGSLHVRWQAHVGFMNVVVAAAGPEKTWSGIRTAELFAGDSRVLRLVLPGEEFAVERDKKAAKRRWREYRNDRAQAAPASFYLSPQAAFSGGVTRFSWSATLNERESREFRRRFSWDRYEAIGRLGVASETPETFKHVHVGSDEDQSFSARGIVYDAYGDPVEGALVTVGKTIEVPTRGVFCDKAGKFEIAGLDPGIWHVWAGGGSEGASLSTRRVEQGDARWGKIVLERGFDLTGELFSAENLPVGDWLVELQGTDRSIPFNAVARTEQDGRFSFCNLPAGKLKLHVRPYESSWTIPTKTVDVASNENFVSIQLGSGPAAILGIDSTLIGPGLGALLGIKIKNAGGHTERAAEVRLSDESSGRGTWYGSSFQTFETLGRLMPGTYRCFAVSGSRGASKVEWVNVDVESELERVTLRLPDGGSVSFEESAPRKGERVYTVWKKGLEVDSVVSTVKNRVPDRMDLPEGEYELELTAKDFPPAALPFWISKRNETSVVIPELE